MKRSGKFYRKNEAEVMKDLGLVPTKGSGAGWIEKEDGYNEHVLCQLKSTEATSIRFVKQDWDKLELHAITEKKVPVFAFQFIQSEEVFLVIKPEDFEQTYQALFKGKSIAKESVICLTEEEQEQRIYDKAVKSDAKARQKFYEEKEATRKERMERWQKPRK